MKKFKKHIMVSAILLIILVSSVACGQTGARGQIDPAKQVKKFLTGVQKQDFKSILDMTYYYQMELNKIKSSNPEILWPKLTSEYYESKLNILLKWQDSYAIIFGSDTWANSRLIEADLWGMGNEFFGTVDPVKNIEALVILLNPHPPEWKIIESKREKQFDSMEGRQYDVYVVYVSLNYKTVDESPDISEFPEGWWGDSPERLELAMDHSKVLKEAILGFVLDANTGLYIWSGRVEKGDVYW